MTKCSANIKLEWAKIYMYIVQQRIRFVKKLQQQITYYSVALMSGIYVIIKSNIASDNLILLIKWLIVLIMVVAIIYIVYINYKGIMVNRRYLDSIKNEYPIISRIINEMSNERQNDMAWRKDIFFLAIF